MILGGCHLQCLLGANMSISCFPVCCWILKDILQMSEIGEVMCVLIFGNSNQVFRIACHSSAHHHIPANIYQIVPNFNQHTPLRQPDVL